MSTKTKIVVASVALVAVAGGGFAAFKVLGTGGHTSSSASASGAPSVPAGYTTTVTVPTIAPDQPKPAQDRPSVAPAKIFAQGACKDAMDGVRAVMDKYPSGLALDDAGSKALNEALPKLSASCTPDLGKAFQAQELGPWLNYTVKK